MQRCVRTVFLNHQGHTPLMPLCLTRLCVGRHLQVKAILIFTKEVVTVKSNSCVIFVKSHLKQGQKSYIYTKIYISLSF